MLCEPVEVSAWGWAHLMILNLLRLMTREWVQRIPARRSDRLTNKSFPINFKAFTDLPAFLQCHSTLTFFCFEEWIEVSTISNTLPASSNSLSFHRLTEHHVDAYKVHCDAFNVTFIINVLSMANYISHWLFVHSILFRDVRNICWSFVCCISQ